MADHASTAVAAAPVGGRTDELSIYQWGAAPDGLATRRQLAARGLRPGGQAPVGQLQRPRRRRPDTPLVAYLYRLDQAKPQRRLTPALLAAVWTAARSRQRCETCGRTDLGYVPRQAAPCWDCMGLPQADREQVPT